MARSICSICGWDHRRYPEISRTQHLLEEHGRGPILDDRIRISRSFEGIVRMYFISPGHITVKHRENWVEYSAKKMLIIEVG